MSTGTQIRVDAAAVTLINVFTVEPDCQDLLVHLLEQATEDVMGHRPGFVSVNIHCGLDGSTVANYAQWASRADFEAMLADPVAREHMHTITAMAESRPAMYKVASAHTIGTA